MDNTKNDKYYLSKILADLEFMIKQTQGKTKDEIEKDALLIDSIMFRLIQIAECNEKLTPELREKHNKVSWKAIKGLRNRIVHDYGVVDMGIIYDTVINSIPELYKILKELL